MIPQKRVAVLKGDSPGLLWVVTISAACRVRSPSSTPAPPDWVSRQRFRLLGLTSQEQKHFAPVLTPKPVVLLPSLMSRYQGASWVVPIFCQASSPYDLSQASPRQMAFDDRRVGRSQVRRNFSNGVFGDWICTPIPAPAGVGRR